MQQATIVTDSDAPEKLIQTFYDLWADEEAYNGDYILWEKQHDEKYPEFSAWLHGNVEAFIDETTKQTVKPDSSMPILIHFGW